MRKILMSLFSLAVLVSCDFLAPLPNGHYTDENIDEYPSLIRGYVEKSYNLIQKRYDVNEHFYVEGATDNAVLTSETNWLTQFARGAGAPSGDLFADYWDRDYRGIMYVNKFLENNVGFTTRYMLDNEQNAELQRMLQGDAYALRAWWHFDLLRKWGGRGADGEILGIPLVTEPIDIFNADMNSFKRNTYEECVEQILADCDSAIFYLPEANRDWVVEDKEISGAVRWHRFDDVSMMALKAMLYLQWASPAFNPENDKTRWEEAAKYAAAVMDFKLNQDGKHGFDPQKSFSWSDPNSPEIVFASQYVKGSEIEACFYPNGFLGSGEIGPSKNLVDAFPMANGYPIDHPKSGYDPQKPHEGRDPRFYSNIFYHGSQVLRSGSTEVMYTFDMSTTGKDVAGLVKNTRTNYYTKKFIYTGWNKSDDKLQTMPKSVFYMRWSQMCLIFAEAANRAWESPEAVHYGFSPKQAVAYLRNRTTTDGAAGLGRNGDPYLDECAAAGWEKFEELIRNERRIELAFEGARFFDLRRWATDVSSLNKPVYRSVVSPDGVYSQEEIETRNFSSIYLPLPLQEIVKMPGMVQNEGWPTWQ